MVAVITGNALRLAGGSVSVLGAGGQLGSAVAGRGGDLAYVNAKTGNLLVQHQDELLVGRGPDIGVVRTYNCNTWTWTDGNSQISESHARIPATTNEWRSTGQSDLDGNALTYSYDATTGLISQIMDANGDLTQHKDSRGNTVSYTYDTNGKLTRQEDAAGNVVERSYDSANQLVKEAAYAVPDPDSAGAPQATVAQSTNYVYSADNKQHLRFVVSPKGRVTEYRYDAYGQQIASLT